MSLGEPLRRVIWQPPAGRALATELFANLLKAQVIIRDWKQEYNTAGLTPALDGWPRRSTLRAGGSKPNYWTNSHREWTDKRGRAKTVRGSSSSISLR